MAVPHHQARRPATLAVVVSAGVSVYLPRTLAAVAEQTHAPDVVLVVDVGAPGRDLGTGIPVHEAVTDAGLEAVTRVRVVRAPEATTFGEAVRLGLVAYRELVERAARRAHRRGWDGGLSGQGTLAPGGPWAGVTGELNPVTTGEIRAVGEGRADPAAAADWLWLLHDDSAPEPAALDQLLHAAESGRSVAVAGAKQRDWAEPDRLLEVGVRATRSARRVSDIEPGEIDQGQHDDREDVLAVGLAGALVRSDVWEELGGPDPVLGPFGDGLDLSRRARLARHRVVVVPTAVVHHARASFLGLRGDGGPTSPDRPDPRRSFLARRRAQLHNALVAAPAAAVPFLLLGLVILAPLRALWRIATKELGLAAAEIGAALAVLGAPGALWRARRTAGRTRRLSPRALAPLQATGADIRRTKRDVRRQATAARRAAQAPSELEIAERAALARRRRVVGAVVAVVLAAVALVTFLPVVQGGALTGGALLPADTRLGDLWGAARSGWVPGGDGTPGPPDALWQVLAALQLPFAAFGASTSVLLSVLVLLALPLAGAGAWFAAGAATRAVALRAWAAAGWALAPPLLLAVGQGRVGALLAHLALPWVALGVARAAGVNRRDIVLPGLVGARRVVPVTTRVTGDEPEPRVLAGPPEAGVVARRSAAGSVAAAAGAALALAVAAAGAPVLLPTSLLVLAVVAVVVPRRRLLVLAVPLPALVLLAPTVVTALSDVAGGSWRLLVSDPGRAWSAGQAPAWLGVLGWPVRPPAFPGLAGDGVAGFLATWGLLAGGAVLTALALVALVRGTARARAVRAGWLLVVAGLGVAVLSARTGVAVGSSLDGSSQVVTGWPGTGLSLVVLGMLLAAVAGGDGLRTTLAGRSFGWRQVVAAALTVLAVLGPLATVGGWLVAVRAGLGEPTALLAVTARTADPVPAVAGEMQRSGQRSRVLALVPTADGLRAELWRGPGPQLVETSSAADLRELAAVETRTGSQDSAADAAPGDDPASAADDASAPDAADAALAAVVAALAAGATEDVGPALGEHAVGVVVIPPEPGYVPPGTEPTGAERTALVARLDATAGLERVTENAAGVVWRVSTDAARSGAAESVARARVVDADGAWVQDVDAGVVKIGTELASGPEGRRLVLAEGADAGWQAWYDGRPLRATTDGWRQAFELPAHTGTLTVGYVTPLGGFWTWAQGIVLGLTALLALPVRRRRGEID
ncbi:glycosyltransferase [Georgenia muralis]